MAQAIRTRVHGLKCDAPDCDYRCNDVTAANYEEWLDKPCPKCGANLLTKEDLALLRAMESTVAWLNELVGPVEPSEKPPFALAVDMDGSGIPSFRIKEAE